MSKTKLAIMACPYCGFPEPDVEEHTEDQNAETVIVWCMCCGEQCVITRNMDEGDDE